MTAKEALAHACFADANGASACCSKKEMDRPSDAPVAFTVPDKSSPFAELRDMMEVLPFDLASDILRPHQGRDAAARGVK